MTDMMKLVLDAGRILKVNDALIKSDSKKETNLKTKEGQELNCFIPAALYVGRLSSRKGFIGDTKEEQASVYQWLEYCMLNLNHQENQEILKELNAFLVDKVYFVGNGLTIADLFLYLSLHQIYSKLTFQDKELYVNLSRWFRQVQNDACAYDLYPKISFSKTRIYT